ncbi:MAG: translation initiation factor IF-1 [Verrucomicrobia bacterium]|nr:translation initiation factor IF-1 [Verrucomicrobiota bacterium]
MSQDDAIRGAGIVIEVLPNCTARVEMPNGHRVLGYCAGRARAEADKLAPGDQVVVEMTCYDMSKARIVGVGK